MNKQNIMPSVVLTAICVIACALLMLANEITKEPIARVRAENTQKALSETFGEGEYTLIEWKNDDVSQTYIKDDGTVIFQIIASGYNKDSIDMLIGVDENGISGIGIVSISETAGVGTKVDDNGFLNKFFGKNSESEISHIDAITGATYSSEGVKNAANSALKAYDEYSGEAL